MTIPLKTILHILRNPSGCTDDEVREVRLEAANLLEKAALPPQRQPLTDEQINEMGVECGVVSEGYWSEAQIDFARAIERAVTGEQK